MSIYKPRNENPSLGFAIVKIAIGLLFLIVAIAPDDELEMGARGVGIVLALAFLAWGFLPHFFAWRYRRYDAAVKRAKVKLRRETAEKTAAKAARRAVKCPNCGANTHGTECEYCGSPLDG